MSGLREAHRRLGAVALVGAGEARTRHVELVLATRGGIDGEGAAAHRADADLGGAVHLLAEGELVCLTRELHGALDHAGAEAGDGKGDLPDARDVGAPGPDERDQGGVVRRRLADLGGSGGGQQHAGGEH